MAAMFPSGVRPALLTKLAAAAALVALADLIVWETKGFGATVGVFCLAFAAAFALTQPAALRDRRALIFLAMACVMGLLLVERPTFAGWFLFGTFIGMASLSPRAGLADDAWRWLQRLAWQPLVGSIGPAKDLLRLMSPRLKRLRRPGLLALIPMLLLPLVGGLLFLGLFAAANPLIADALSGFEFSLDLPRLIFWGFVFTVVWAVLRPRFLRRPLPTPGVRGEKLLPGVTLASVVLSLVVFNALFAVQNGLDLAFLWSGQRLPEQFTLAEYVKAGVFPLMTSALLTGLFVLVALRPGSEVTANRAVRVLLGLWVAQNLFVVASSAYRMVLYVESYGLTRTRIVVLIWMLLVAIGLASILWRVLRDKTSGWLLNLNASAVLAAIAFCAVVDLGEITARWNIAHAKEMGGRGVELDVHYLYRLGPAAAVPLAELSHRRLPPCLGLEVASQRDAVLHELGRAQDDWRRWTFSGQRRLDRATALARTAPPSKLSSNQVCMRLER